MNDFENKTTTILVSFEPFITKKVCCAVWSMHKTYSEFKFKSATESNVDAHDQCK